MNSYPVELLAQLAPVMFVAGLGGPSTHQEPTSVKTQDPFASLVSRLRDTLQAQLRPSIWTPERNKSFQIVLVDKHVRFPPRKLVTPEDPSYASAHSPLSPLTPSSPLYPDGLIAPIWIRKHTALLPSVFVLFLRMYEASSAAQRSPLDTPDAEHERNHVEEERKRDTELSAEIAQRKKMTNERGIKLTAVLLASRKMLDDPSLDGRLSYIRKQSGLDSRAALFVLSPVSSSELEEFVRSLQDALYEPSVEYYTSHSKRVRRKRNRHSQTSSYNPPPLIPVGTASPRPLRPEGWTVRYEYKMACFAEFRGEDEVALKHYQDAYTTLMIMFGSTAILPPRTKRWAEAKVLSDTISLKITKLYLYNNEHALALSHHNLHMRRFADFSRGWGIGEETFEYWSWMARQHRVLAELLEQGSRSTLTFPSHVPLIRASGAPLASAVGPGGAPLDMDAVRTLGLNPSHALQHPGHYYYMAARCTEARRERFLASESTSQANSAPGYANEQKVDHLTIALELYTKSYELFKKYSSTTSQGRLTLWIAFRIAHTYYQSGKYELAIRFFERIAKTYRREKWNAMLRPLFPTWYACAKKLDDVELTARLLVEMIGYGDFDEPGALQDDLLTLLKTSAPTSTDEALVVDLKESEPILNTSVVFWKSEVRVGEEAAFQISLTAPSDIMISELPIHSISFFFSEGYPPIVIHHDAVTPSEPVRLVPLGRLRGEAPVEAKVHLRWRSGDVVILMGTLVSDVPGVFNVTTVVMTLKEASWIIEVPHERRASRESSPAASRWLSSIRPVTFIPVVGDDASSVTVRHRPHQLSVSFSHQEQAMLDEAFPIAIEVINTDDHTLDVVVDVLLQPTGVDEAVQFITFDSQKSSGLIKGVRFGTVKPGVSVVKTLVLMSSGAPGDRTIDISVQSSTTLRPASVSLPQSQSEGRSPSPSETMDASPNHDACEILRTLFIPTLSAFVVHQEVAYQRSLQPPPLLADLSVLDGPHWDACVGGNAVVTTVIECGAPCGVEVESVMLHRVESANARVVGTTLEALEETLHDEYLTGDQFSDVCVVVLASTEGDTPSNEIFPGPGEYVITWKRIQSPGNYGPRSSTRIPLPPLRPPHETLVALLSVPATARLHMPVPIHLTVRNGHGSRSAVISVALDPQPSDGFVVAGLRSGRLPLVLPGAEERITWNLIAIECGYVKVPRVRVLDHRRMGGGQDSMAAGGEGGEGELVHLVDVRFERGGEEVEKGQIEMGTILVSP